MRTRLYTFVVTSVLLFAACSPRTQNQGDAAVTAAANNASAADSLAPSASSPNAPETRDLRDDPRDPELPVVLFLGDSITAGFGLDPDVAFPALIQRRADAEGVKLRSVNAGLSGETSAGGLRRIEWLLREQIDVLVLELGGNDGLRGVDLATTAANLQGIIDQTLAKWPNVEVVLAGMMIPPNLGTDYTTQFRDLYPNLAASNESALIPFLLEGVAGVDGMMQGDGIHPTAAGNEVIAELIWPYVLDALPGS